MSTFLTTILLSHGKVSAENTAICSNVFTDLYYEQHVVALLIFFSFSISDNSNPKVLDPVLLCLISCNVVFVMVIIILLAGYYKNWRKRQKGKIPFHYLSRV